jgi:hypothetical protein
VNVQVTGGRLIRVEEVVHRPDMVGERPAPISPAPEGAAEVAEAVPAAPVVVLAEPKPAEMAANFAVAVARWVAAGAPVVSAEVYAEREAACDSCPLWDAKARLGLGKCKAPKCGCTSLKRWLATEACKHPQGSRWKR